jgi:hypothetical protein
MVINFPIAGVNQDDERCAAQQLDGADPASLACSRYAILALG